MLKFLTSTDNLGRPTKLKKNMFFPPSVMFLFVLKVPPMLRLSENRVLRRIFRPKIDEVTGEWSKLLNEELNDLHSSSNPTQ
jgi:hypothetical protein